MFSKLKGDATISVGDLEHLVTRTPPRYATRLYKRKTNGDSVYNPDQSLELTEYGRTVYEEAAVFVTRNM